MKALSRLPRLFVLGERVAPLSPRWRSGRFLPLGLVGVVMLAGLIGLAAVGHAGDVRLATYNIRVDLPGDRAQGDGWDRRGPWVRSLLEFHQLEVVGVQEATAGQLRDLVADGVYAYVGVGRDDGREAGEHSAILYRTSLWEVLASGSFWLSETPDQVSFGWDAQKYRRLCTWAELRSKKDGARLKIWNAHFDHEAVEARRQSAHLLVARASAAPPEPSVAVVVMGDFNCTEAEEPYQILRKDFLDTREISSWPAYGPRGTFNGFDYRGTFEKRIDHILVGPGVKVGRHGTLTDAVDGRFPSDHFPVVVDLVWPTRG